MKINEIRKGVFHVSEKTQNRLARTFVRFQEHYESQNPKFRKEGFSLKEFKIWYNKAQKSKRFTYYSDWGGFNFPGYILESFYAGKFKNLTKAEKKILAFFKSKDLRKVYIIGTYGDDGHSALDHEISHALFYLDKTYQTKATKIVSNTFSLAISNLRTHLRKLGYAESVLIDESQAYIAFEEEYLKAQKIWWKDMDAPRNKLRQLFEKHLK